MQITQVRLWRTQAGGLQVSIHGKDANGQFSASSFENVNLGDIKAVVKVAIGEMERTDGSLFATRRDSSDALKERGLWPIKPQGEE